MKKSINRIKFLAVVLSLSVFVSSCNLDELLGSAQGFLKDFTEHKDGLADCTLTTTTGTRDSSESLRCFVIPSSDGTSQVGAGLYAAGTDEVLKLVITDNHANDELDFISDGTDNRSNDRSVKVIATQSGWCYQKATSSPGEPLTLDTSVSYKIALAPGTDSISPTAGDCNITDLQQ